MIQNKILSGRSAPEKSIKDVMKADSCIRFEISFICNKNDIYEQSRRGLNLLFSLKNPLGN